MEPDMRSPITVFVILLLATATAFADPPADKGKPEKGPDKGKPDDGLSVDVDLRFGGIDVREARELAREYGATGYKPLPPGIRKNLARGKPMPPGIQKTRMPDGFIGRLPAYEGYRWDAAGTDLLLVQVASGVVADVLSNVFD
jgi:hypothetical protein